ncbi:uncharacterized protein LOC111325407 [Stylophora pistillata]|uniref:uncharacterized protein LOC111325407 n=1 Tax=Stylophora pistillata TaxID=50429 RepID=UPI000C0567BD|nr:uncharacterized protein LOC111325407 [Stylophora pistillata]
METTIYEDQSFLLANKNSCAQDNDRLWLNLTTECKTSARRDDFDISDLLRSPDIGISSPDLETIVWRNFPDSCAVKLQSTSSPPTFAAQENYSTQKVTAEQEVFARGFTDALQRLREERELREASKTRTPTIDESNKVDDDSKCTFISYRFDSSFRLPSFQETFLPVKCTGTTIKTKTYQDPRRTLSEREHGQQLEGTEVSEWFKVETLEEGFSGQRQCQYNDCLINSSEEESDDCSTNSPLSDYAANGYGFGDFEIDGRTADDMEFQEGFHTAQDNFQPHNEWLSEGQHIIEDTPTPKHWLTVHTKLYNMSVIKQEPNSVDDQSQSSKMPDVQGFIKTEKKRRKNRLAAWKCRQRKLIRESRLETTVEELCMENSRLMEELEKIKHKRQQLEQTFIKHVTSGCEEAHVQYTETFNGEN